MVRLGWRGGIAVGVAAAVAAGVVVIAVPRSDPERRPATGSPTPAAEPSRSPIEFVRIGGAPATVPERTLDDPTLLPYPFMSPTPPPEVTELDGTYMRTLTLRELGGARIALPYRCLRCPPFRLDPGVSTLVLSRGAYYVHHHLSGFRTLGSFVLVGDRVVLFNDANCPQKPGTYRVEVGRHGLRFRLIEDDCAFSNERALDLTYAPWTRVSACVRRIQSLWPGEIAC